MLKASCLSIVFSECNRLYDYSNVVDEAPAAKKKEDVHVPAKNIGDIKSAEKVQFAPVIPFIFLYHLYYCSIDSVYMYTVIHVITVTMMMVWYFRVIK